MALTQESLGFLLSDVTRLIRRAFQERLEGSTLTLAQARALKHVARNEGVRQVDLAEQLEVQPITLARLIDQLAALGAVERRADPDDRRAYRIHLAPGATVHLDAIEQVAGELRRHALKGLSAAQVAALLAGLEAMHANLSANPERRTP